MPDTQNTKTGLVAQFPNNTTKLITPQNMRNIIVSAVNNKPETSTDNQIQPTLPDVVPVVVKGAASQTADLQQWKDSAGTTLARVDKDGNLYAHGLVVNGEGIGSAAFTDIDAYDPAGSASTEAQAAAAPKADKTTTISTSGTGLTGGGDLSANRTITFDQTAITVAESQVTNLVTDLDNRALKSRTISTSGTGLTGGGDLSANRTITFDQTAIAVAESQVTNLVSDLAAKASTYYVNTGPLMPTVRLHSITNHNTRSGFLTIDGVTLVGGDLLLLSRQLVPATNGIWQVPLAGGAWVRPSWWSSANTPPEGLAVIINEGNSHAGSIWKCINTSAITVDTTSTSWAPIAPGVGEVYLYRCTNSVYPALVRTYKAASNAEADFGTALRNALAVAASTDLVLCGQGNFDVGSTTHIAVPAGVTLRGAGQLRTNIKSALLGSSDSGNPIVTMSGSGAVLEHLTITSTVTDGTYCWCLGGNPASVTTLATVRYVTLAGQSDGFYWYPTSSGSQVWNFENCILGTTYDTVAILGSNGGANSIANFYTCIFNSVGQFPGLPVTPGGSGSYVNNCINMQCGVFNAYNCIFNSNTTSTNTQTTGIWCWSTGSANVHNSVFNVTATNGNKYDMLNGGSGTVTVAGGEGSGTNGAYLLSGTVTYRNEGIVNAATLLANAATNANTPSTIVKRDGSGNFTAGTITGALSGNATTATSATSASTATTATTATNCTRTLTGTAPIQVAGDNSAHDLSANRTISITAADGSNAGSMSAAHYTLVNGATDANTNSTIVKRDASGNFIASNVTVKHLVGNSSTPTISVGPAIGTGGSTVEIVGTDASGRINISTGVDLPADGIAATITFAAAYSSAPYVQLTPANAEAAGLTALVWFVDDQTISTTQFKIKIWDGSGQGITLAEETGYLLHYHVIG